MMNNYAEMSYSPILPIALGALPAAVVTVLLVLLMHSLIASDIILIDDEPTIVAGLVWVDPEPPVLRRNEPPLKPVDPVPPPEQQVTWNAIIPTSNELTGFVGQSLPRNDQKIEIGAGGVGIVAYLKPAPIYPSRQQSKGVEGHVDLAFDITGFGSTTNIRVIDAQPQGAFERAAIRALEKWKYKVPVIDDVPQGQVDMMTRMTFKLEE